MDFLIRNASEVLFFLNSELNLTNVLLYLINSYIIYWVKDGCISFSQSQYYMETFVDITENLTRKTTRKGKEII